MTGAGYNFSWLALTRLDEREAVNPFGPVLTEKQGRVVTGSQSAAKRSHFDRGLAYSRTLHLCIERNIVPKLPGSPTTRIGGERTHSRSAASASGAGSKPKKSAAETWKALPEVWALLQPRKG